MTETEILNGAFQKQPHMVTRRVAGEIILVPVVRQVDAEASLFTLDDVAAFLWERIDGRRTGGELAAELQQAYAVDAATAGADVGRFLAQLQDAGAISLAAQPAAPEP
ncbi:MAG TPA: PqqD family protein, partial [Elusimicrobiota bacterium]|nr:PqqD family protein [Elusimicrobiota bacterium]